MMLCISIYMYIYTHVHNSACNFEFGNGVPILLRHLTWGFWNQTPLLPPPDQCLVIGEITCAHMIVVLNKVDLVEESKREAHVAKVRVARCQGRHGNGCLDTIYHIQLAGCGGLIS